MISKSNEFTRRILNFPAVRPCESVSLSTLLTSLIKLGHTICSFKSKTFFTNKKNAKTSIHLIETLVVFLEEIPIGDSKFDDSMALSLSELHFIFQSVHFLLEDCTKDDARLWMLVKSEKVSTHFRVLIRAIAVALEVMPPCSGFDSACELQELMEFVLKQALKAEFEVEKDDKRCVRRIFRILDRFKCGIAPEYIDLKRVVEHLGIRSWCECNGEVKFLESEIEKECLTAEKRDVGFLSSLMVFLIYCRCTLFVNIDSASNGISQQSVGIYSSEMIKGLNPDDFRCPISMELMVDPVTVSTGHTYDRSSILKWFGNGNHTCPKTGERLICIDLVPNHALKQLIKQYCHENGIPFPELGGHNREIRSSDCASSTEAEKAMTLLATFLVGRLMAGTNEERYPSAYEIRLLTKTSNFNRSCLVGAGAISPLLNLLSSRNSGAQENAMAALMNLAKYSMSKRILVENGGIGIIVNVLNKGLKLEARQHAAGVLFYLASVEEYRRAIGKIPGAIPGLMGLVSDGADRGKKNALVTILGLLMCPDNHWTLLSAGLVPLLINLLSSSTREELVTDSLAVLATLGEELDGAMAIVSAGTLPMIIEVLCSSSSKVAKEYCVSLLLALCINDGADVVPVLVKNPSLMAALYSLLTDGTCRSSKKASSLIRMLLVFNEKSSSGFMDSGHPQEQFVHVW